MRFKCDSKGLKNDFLSCFFRVLRVNNWCCKVFKRNSKTIQTLFKGNSNVNYLGIYVIQNWSRFQNLIKDDSKMIQTWFKRDSNVIQTWSKLDSNAIETLFKRDSVPRGKVFVIQTFENNVHLIDLSRGVSLKRSLRLGLGLVFPKRISISFHFLKFVGFYFFTLQSNFHLTTQRLKNGPKSRALYTYSGSNIFSLGGMD